MDSIEAAGYIMNLGVNTKTATNSSNVMLLTGVATSDSANGVVSVNLGGFTIENDILEEDDDHSVEIDTTVDVREGDVVQVQAIGADGSSKGLLVIGVVGGGDRTTSDISEVSNKADNAMENVDALAMDVDQRFDETDAIIKEYQGSVVIDSEEPSVMIGAGSTDSSYLKLLRDKLSFYVEDNETAWMTSSTLHADTLNIGDFAWIKRENGHISLKIN